MAEHATTHVHLRGGGTSLLLDTDGPALPRVLHWGADLGDLSAADVAALRLAAQPPLTGGRPDLVVPLALLAEQSAGWLGTPGLTGHRDGAHFSTAFIVRALDVTAGDGTVVAQALRVTAADETAGLGLTVDVELLASGLVRLRAAVVNTGAGLFDLHGLELNLPVPTEADELLDLTGRHLRERAPQRAPFTHGTHLRESRGARAHDGALVMAAGRKGFGWRDGEVRAVHVGWSGNTRTYAERTPTAALLGGGELLLAGEARLPPGGTYAGPWLYFSHGEGLDALAGRFHSYLRSRPEHPRSPRPVHVNVWEAVYFDHDHDLDRLKELADLAASVGVERYVLDDGWFGSRRDDTSGLGDWVVSPDVWPGGLGPIVDHVHDLGMQFGLWFEPEMVNPDSDVARAHPEWILAPGERLPVPARNQQVLNLAIPEAYAHVRDQMLAVLGAHRIDYIKWDHNRDLVEAGERSSGHAVVREQTLAMYRLMDELKAAHPGLEIEFCAGGGGRPDLGVMARADRIWGSDCIDPLERQLIEAGTSLFLPPEMVGSHIASTISHTTGRAHSLDFRAGTAFFSHLGIEWDLTAAGEDELEQLRRWLATHKEHRDLLHTGTVVHLDHPDDALWVHGVVAADGSEAIFTVVSLRTSDRTSPGAVRLAGLDAGARYRVRPLPPGDAVGGRTSHGSVAWWADGAELPTAVLEQVGVQVPNLKPEQMVLLHLVRV